MKGGGALSTLAALFLLAGGGQVVGAIAVTAADAGREAGAAETVGSGAEIKEVTPGGIVVRNDEAEGKEESDEARLLAARRLELRQASAEMKVERRRMEAAREALEVHQSTERQKLADLYARMPAEKSAVLLAALPAGDAARFIAAMPGETGASILAAMPDETAVAVTMALAGQGQ